MIETFAAAMRLIFGYLRDGPRGWGRVQTNFCPHHQNLYYWCWELHYPHAHRQP